MQVLDLSTVRAARFAVSEWILPGRFLLTGSANVFMLPNAAESLAGDIEVLTLEPSSQGEIEASGHPACCGETLATVAAGFCAFRRT